MADSGDHGSFWLRSGCQLLFKIFIYLHGHHFSLGFSTMFSLINWVEVETWRSHSVLQLLLDGATARHQHSDKAWLGLLLFPNKLHSVVDKVCQCTLGIILIKFMFDIGFLFVLLSIICRPCLYACYTHRHGMQPDGNNRGSLGTRVSLSLPSSEWKNFLNSNDNKRQNS